MQRFIEVPFQGVTIRGTVYLPQRSRRHPTVLMLHSFTGNRIETGFLFVEIGRELARRGMAAISFDFRNSGESNGLFEDTLPTDQLADARHMNAWMRAQPFVDRQRTAMLGYSLGGLLAACLAPDLEHGGAQVLLAPTTVENLCRFAGSAQGAGRVIIGPHTLHERFFDDLQTLDPLAACRASRAATLLIQGTADKAVPPTVAEVYREALNAAAHPPATIEMVDAADHRFSGPVARRHVVKRVAGWLEAHFAAAGDQRRSPSP